ncbi:SIMPL domain-containing protein [Nostoc sp. ChiVER01]|uniref:SIMPL domain-containing protein n=1 Tax=Nostoc sp. ChiVER01 TaxID=3075382 RepID=UPI002AD5A60A|nr:SIMPL domain-containing protein [Nostoc sp. ChiVER01]MDZ8221597.1 SIMPL domain-containing protein [Nostoc sp. ChiVER01]
MANTNNNLTVASEQALVIIPPLTGNTNPNTAEKLEVTGQGEITVPTTLTEVQLGIQVQGKTSTEVQEETAQRSAEVVDVLKKLGAQELQTTSIQLNPVYKYDKDGNQTLIGFKGLNKLQFELPTDQAGGAIDKAIKAGANLIENINFTPSDKALQQARLQVLSEAVKDAQAQANAVFSTLQLTPGKIIDIDINSTANPSPSPLLLEGLTLNKASFAADITTPIIGSPETIKASVSLDIGYSQNSAGTLASATNDNLTGAIKQALGIIDPLTGSTNSNTVQKLEVTGQGKVTVPSTLTEVQLGIQVQGKTATEVQEEVAQRSTAVVDVLKKLGAQELQTTSIQLNPVYKYDKDGNQTLIGFKGLNKLQFELPTDQAGGAIDKAIKAGANLIENISFTASDEALKQARLQVLSEAAKDAQAQANTVFSTLQLTPGKIIDIDINSASNPSPSPLDFNLVAGKAFATGTTTPLIGGPLTIEASVSLDIAYSSTPAGTLGLAFHGLQ